jgi:hypothetical protein
VFESQDGDCEADLADGVQRKRLPVASVLLTTGLPMCYSRRKE